MADTFYLHCRTSCTVEAACTRCHGNDSHDILNVGTEVNHTEEVNAYCNLTQAGKSQNPSRFLSFFLFFAPCFAGSGA